VVVVVGEEEGIRECERAKSALLVGGNVAFWMSRSG
jgi:hypothetical protein